MTSPTTSLIERYYNNEARESAFHDDDLPYVGLEGIGRPLSRSGESVAYLMETGDTVLKVGCNPLLEVYQKVGALGLTELRQDSIDKIQSDERQMRHNVVNRTVERQAELQQCFPTIHVNESWALQDVPIQGKLLTYLLRSQTYDSISGPYINEEETYVFQTIVRTQRYIPGFDEMLTVSTRYAEVDWDNDGGLISREDYIAGTSIVFGDEPQMDLEELLKVQGSPFLRELVHAIPNDPAAYEFTCDFLSSYGKYAALTGGAITDIMGKRNLNYSPHDKTGYMIDGLYAEDVLPLQGAAHALQKIARDELPPLAATMNQLVNTLNFLRGLGILAKAVGIRGDVFLERPPKPSKQLNTFLDMLRTRHDSMFLNDIHRVM